MLAPPHVSSTSYSNCQIVPPRSKLTVCVSVTDFWMELLTLLELSRAADPDTSTPEKPNPAETLDATAPLHESVTSPPFSFTVPSMYEMPVLAALVDECTFHSPLADVTVQPSVDWLAGGMSVHDEACISRKWTSLSLLLLADHHCTYLTLRLLKDTVRPSDVSSGPKPSPNVDTTVQFPPPSETHTFWHLYLRSSS